MNAAAPHHKTRQRPELVAVLMDFFIVVLGVFIGMQVANRNDPRASKQATISVLERLNAEIDTNSDAADNVIARIDESADIRAVAISASEAPANQWLKLAPDRALCMSAFIGQQIFSLARTPR